jgi:tetratricopeptide (TPR) repeat protein/TolB-like protein
VHLAPSVRTALPALLIALATASRLDAQCADGSPPPCRSATPATPRRVNPPIDDRTWIVVPFDNLANANDVDWLRNASVNLLYLDMSRWRDIRVIDDERVADLMREVESGRAAQNVSLATGLAVAKRAGAGKLVMGDVLKLGSRTTVTAKVFDVKTGQRLRSVREETTVADSIMPMFGKLARKVLNVAPPQSANVGALGTTSVEAYQEYIAGVTALNRYDLASARQRFNTAIRIDSTFALAHHKQSIVIGWADVSDRSRRTHAEAAHRLATALPARERALIAGQLQQSTGDWPRACDTYRGLVRADSSDVEAWYGIGECLFHDPSSEVVGDPPQVRFRADLDGSIRAFSRVLQLDPTYHLAYQHIIDALVPERGQLCHRPNPSAPCTLYGAFPIRSGDTLVVMPVAIVADSAKLRAQAERFVQTASRRRNLDIARTFAEAWVQAAPAEAQAHRALARVLVLQGHVAEANAEMALVKEKGTLQEELRRILERIEIAYKLWQGAEANRIYDSARASNIPLPGVPFTFGNAISGFAPSFGRLAEFDSLMSANARGGSAPDALQRFQRFAVRSLLSGVAHDSLIAAEKAAFDQAAPRGASAATRTIAPSLAFALRAPRSSWPALDTSGGDPRLRPAIALSQGDTAKLRSAAQALDSIAASMTSAGVADSGYALVAAEAYLALRDSAAALRATRFALDLASKTTSYFPQNTPGVPPVFFAPRTMLLRADLAAAAGQRDEARTWYKRFIDLWSNAAPDLKPLVERARKSLAALGGAT